MSVQSMTSYSSRAGYTPKMTQAALTSKKTVGLTLPKSQIENRCSPSRLLCRFVLNHPSPEAKALVKRAFVNLGNLVKKYHLTPPDFEYLLEAVPDARSAYSWKHSPDPAKRLIQLEKLVKQLINFDVVEDFDKNFPQYASDLDTLMTALGYRAVGRPAKSTTQLSSNLKSLLQDFNQENYIIESIAHQFPNRKKEEDTSKDPANSIEIFPEFQDEVLQGLPGPQPGLRREVFTKSSYVAKALSKGIPMRANTSSSASLSLAAAQFVLNNGTKKSTPNESELIKLGGLFCAAYNLGDFHSCTETAAGIAHFYQIYVNTPLFTNQRAPFLEQVDPKTFYALSFGFLSSIVAVEHMNGFTRESQKVLDHFIES